MKLIKHELLSFLNSYENGEFSLFFCILVILVLAISFFLKSIVVPLFVYISKRYFKKKLEGVPSISFFIDPGINVRKKGLSVVSLTKKKNVAVYVQCTVTNSGLHDITLIKICNHRLQCNILKPKDKYSFSIRMEPKDNNIKVIVQNELNETFEGSYVLLYRPKSNRTNIEIQHSFHKTRMFTPRNCNQ